ncbi:stage II sporulation protein P [Paenibacillus thermoaerophilus]|uniref:Stage II sporulation protein P n=1 Tax=Paenibacillus thermoaerophilus TaxID=1215385 RepID=A0ABW2V1B7_9BACL|nr:stage II sporulation protein P [Paenibacillus thermoaerophilus]TMV18987.1 stage II sporulation protein P [Paenibacillus thermoaerophilus]
MPLPNHREPGAVSIRGMIRWAMAGLTALHLIAAVAGPLASRFAPQAVEGLAELAAGRRPDTLAAMMAGELPGKPGGEALPSVRSLAADWLRETERLRRGEEDKGQTKPAIAPDVSAPPAQSPAASPPPSIPSEPPSLPAVAPTHTSGGEASSDRRTTEGRRVVFIYHSHPRESWKPETKKADDAERNITLVGKRLKEKLEALGIGAMHSGVDYQTAVPAYNWSYSYSYSLNSIREAIAAEPDLKFFFDLHRDANGRDLTTVKREDGRGDLGKIMFVVGRQNKHWEQNEAFAKRLDELLNGKVPGISRGIRDKDKSEGHGEYNQSVSPNSILIEIGGVENTLEECLRTADVLAEAVAELYWQAEKVDAVAELAMS